MKKVLRVAAVSVMALSFTTGIAAASTGTIGTTGPDSTNRVRFTSSDTRSVYNNNTASVSNSNPQSSSTGDVRVRHNTTGGHATSGDAVNDSLQRTTARFNNSSSSASAVAGMGSGSHTGSINNTGPDSTNEVTFSSTNSATVTNNNVLSVSNVNTQTATSGDATVRGNTTGGNATSGDASNISTSETTVEITN